jgi:hypothetical protein
MKIKSRTFVMTKHTQAHLARTVDQNQPSVLRDRTKRQMEYYMGAKLLEIGVDPQVAIYRWTSEIKGRDEVLTYSAYWGDSKAQMLQQEQDT